jgi:hypothetical protein
MSACILKGLDTASMDGLTMVSNRILLSDRQKYDPVHRVLGQRRR